MEVQKDVRGRKVRCERCERCDDGGVGDMDGADRTDRLSRLGRAGRGAGRRLTEREQEIVGLVGDGLVEKEIAVRLAVAVKTIGTHLNNIRRKLGLGDRVALMRWAMRHGLSDQEPVVLHRRRSGDSGPDGQ